MTEIHRTPAFRCPTCGEPLDAHGGHPGQDAVAPAAGDLTVCIYCVAILRFGEDRLAVVTGDELLQEDPATRAAISASVRMIRDYNRFRQSLRN